MVTLNLPGGAVTLEAGPVLETGAPWTRTAYAAAHVVADPLAEADPWLDCALDWDRTLAFREHLWSLGFGVAEAMDTAQRGMGLDWPTSLELIQRSAALARAGGHLIASGVGTDHIAPGPGVTVDDLRVGLPVELVVDTLFTEGEVEHVIWKWKPVTEGGAA